MGIILIEKDSDGSEEENTVTITIANEAENEPDTTGEGLVGNDGPVADIIEAPQTDDSAAPPSAGGSPSKSWLSGGFSQKETIALVVIFLLGIVAAALVLSVPSKDRMRMDGEFDDWDDVDRVSDDNLDVSVPGIDIISTGSGGTDGPYLRRQPRVARWLLHHGDPRRLHGRGLRGGREGPDLHLLQVRADGERIPGPDELEQLDLYKQCGCRR
jgi:hypothetical protein